MGKVKMFNGKMLEIGDKIFFADLWQSDDGDEEELLDSGCVWVANGESDEPIIADFEIIKKDEENLTKSLVKVTDIR
mgnify:FL=1